MTLGVSDSVLRNGWRVNAETDSTALPPSGLTAADTALLGHTGEAPGEAKTPTLLDAQNAALRTNAEPGTVQLRNRLEQQVAGKGALPNPAPNLGGANPTRGAGGKGGLFSDVAKTNATTALKAEGAPDPDHPYVAEKADTRRAIDQLGLPRTGSNRLYVNDGDAEHGADVTRTLAGKTSLAQGAEVYTKAAPAKDPNLPQPEPGAPVIGGLGPIGAIGQPADPSTDDLIKSGAGKLISNVSATTKEIADARAAVEKKGDKNKTFMNMSWGTDPEREAGDITAKLISAEPGTKLYDEATKFLGHPPTRTTMPGGGVMFEGSEAKKIHEGLVYPRLKAEMATPEFQANMTKERKGLEDEVARARKANIMVFQSAGNEGGRADRAGDPAMSISTTEGIPGIFRVGAADTGKKGPADDRMADFTADGRVHASAAGVNVPVGLDKDGKTEGVDGTSFASPIMAETAYMMSSINPKLSLDQIERLLTDPRVAQNIPGTTRDGAGVVDQFAAAVLAKNPNLTRAQIDDIRSTLDANADKKYTLVGNRLVLP